MKPFWQVRLFWQDQPLTDTVRCVTGHEVGAQVEADNAIKALAKTIEMRGVADVEFTRVEIWLLRKEA